MHRLVRLTVIALLVAGACDGGGGSAEAYCDAIRSFRELESDLRSLDIPRDASVEEQMQSMRDAFEPMKDRLAQLRRAAPSEIGPEVRELADAADALLDVFLRADSMEDLTGPDVAEELAEIQADAQEARDRVAEFTEEECEIDLDGTRNPTP